jgi:glutaminyl-peptide cyclotransferase
MLLSFSQPRTVTAQSVRGGANTLSVAQTGGATPFSGQRAFEHVKHLVEFGPHPAGSKAIERARRYIIEQLPNASRDEWVADTPTGKVRMVNIVTELKGESDDTIIIASHYDTKPFKDFTFVGANDSGSSTGALIEIADTLAASNKQHHFTYRFVFFDGEEAFCRDWDECGKPDAPDNTYGSRRYVAQLRVHNQLKKVRALILLDMMGYDKLDLGRDDMSTPWLVDIIWKTAQGIGYSKQFVDRAEGVGGDDHAPFLQAGIPSADIIQLSTYPYWHKPEDTLDKVSPASLKAVGDAVIASLPRIEDRLQSITALLSKPFEVVKTDKSEGVIVPAEYRAWNACRHDAEACGRWTPAKEDVFRLEHSLEPYLKWLEPSVTPRILQNLATYKRQYIGFSEAGRKKILVHSFAEGASKSLDWHKNVEVIFDGGDYFFKVIYDVESGTFSDFRISGYA